LRGVWACLGVLAGAGGILMVLLKLYRLRGPRQED
jgi:hypothetical protein